MTFVSMFPIVYQRYSKKMMYIFGAEFVAGWKSYPVEYRS